MIQIKQKGNFNKLEQFFKNVSSLDYGALEKYGKMGVEALASATPIESGETAQSWFYEIVKNHGGVRINWKNSHVVDGVPIAIILQYGHGTRNGGYVQGRDFINPAISPIFDKMTNDLWKEVIK